MTDYSKVELKLHFLERLILPIIGEKKVIIILFSLVYCVCTTLTLIMTSRKPN